MYSKAKKTAQWAVSKMRSLSARMSAPMDAAPNAAPGQGKSNASAAQRDRAKAKTSPMAYQQGFTSGPMT